MTELIQGKIYKPKKSKKALPSIKEIVEERMNLGIAGVAESTLYYKGDLDESEYSDETKEQLLAEIEQIKENKKRFAKLGKNLYEKDIEYQWFSYGLVIVYDHLFRPLNGAEIVKAIEEQIESTKEMAKDVTDPDLPLKMIAKQKGLEYGLTELKEALGKTK